MWPFLSHLVTCFGSGSHKSRRGMTPFSYHRCWILSAYRLQRNYSTTAAYGRDFSAHFEFERSTHVKELVVEVLTEVPATRCERNVVSNLDTLVSLHDTSGPSAGTSHNCRWYLLPDPDASQNTYPSLPRASPSTDSPPFLANPGYQSTRVWKQ